MQEMTVEDEERREAHLHQIRMAASCVEQIVEKEDCECCLPLHYKCQEYGCVPMSDTCSFHDATRRSDKERRWAPLWFFAEPGSATGIKVASWFFHRRFVTHSCYDLVGVGRVL